MNGALIRYTRKAKGFTQQELADLVETSQSVIAELETGTRIGARLGTLKRISLTLGISLDDMLADPTPATQPEPAATPA